MLVDKLARIEA